MAGLETGLDKFEPRRGGRLSTTVYWYVHTLVARGHAVMKVCLPPSPPPPPPHVHATGDLTRVTPSITERMCPGAPIS